MEIYKDVHELLKKKTAIPFKVKAQIEDAALSLSRNIGEGYARRTLKENLRYYEIAASSAAEVYSQVYALNCTDQISDEEFRSLDDNLYKFENKIIAMNRKMIKKIKNGEEWKSDYQ